MTCVLRSLAAWILLVAYALGGVVPGQGLVVCTEADGSSAIELLASGCGDCRAEVSPARTSDAPASRVDSCPCSDTTLLLASHEPKFRPRFSGPDLDGIPPPAPCASTVLVVDPGSCRPSPRPADRPRPAERLTSIRTIVLRV